MGSPYGEAPFWDPYEGEATKHFGNLLGMS